MDAALQRTTDGPDLRQDWSIGTGTATSIHETAPPTDHISEAWATLREDGIYEIAVGTVEFGEGTSTAHVQIAANRLGTTPSRIHLVQSDTDRTGFDTGAFASAGLFVAGNAVNYAATALRDRILAFAATQLGVDPSSCELDDDGVVCGSARISLTELLEAARKRRIRFTEARKAYGSPRSVSSNAHGFRVAVHRVTGEIRILYSVQCHRRRRRHQPGSGARPDRRWGGSGYRLRPYRELPRQRARRDDQSQPAQLPHSHLRRHSTNRRAGRRIARFGRADGVQGHRLSPASIRSPPHWPTQSPMRPACAIARCPCLPSGFTSNSAPAARFR